MLFVYDISITSLTSLNLIAYADSRARNFTPCLENFFLFTHRTVRTQFDNEPPNYNCSRRYTITNRHNNISPKVKSAAEF